MRRAALLGDGWYPYFYSPELYRESVSRIQEFASDAGRDVSAFEWAFYSFISIYDDEEDAARAAAAALGGRYSSQGSFMNVVRRYCVFGSVDACVERLKEYVDAGARDIVFSVSCPPEDRQRHAETLVGEVMPRLPGGCGGNATAPETPVPYAPGTPAPTLAGLRCRTGAWRPRLPSPPPLPTTGCAAT